MRPGSRHVFQAAAEAGSNLSFFHRMATGKASCALCGAVTALCGQTARAGSPLQKHQSGFRKRFNVIFINLAQCFPLLVIDGLPL